MGSEELKAPFDILFVDYIEEHGIQVWPNRDKVTGEVTSWTVQNFKPFVQITRETLKAAITKLFFDLEELKFTQNDNSRNY